MLPLVVAIIFISLPLAIIWWVVKSLFQVASKPSRDAQARAAIEARVSTLCGYFQRINETRAFPDVPLNVNIRRDEFGVQEASGALYEYRKKNYRVGGAVRVARGVYLGGSEQISRDELREVASGVVALTNRRLVFLSDQRTTVIEHADVLSLDVSGDDTVQIHTSKRKTPIILRVAGCDVALLVLLIKLFCSGDFTNRILPDGLILDPAHDGNGGVSVNVRQEAINVSMVH